MAEESGLVNRRSLNALVHHAATIDDIPTVAQIDEMLAVLSGFATCPEDTAISDKLLEMRHMMTSGEAPAHARTEASPTQDAA